MTMLIFLLMAVSSVFIWLSHPISMGITIIIQTVIISIITGLMLGSFWFSYIILISMLSGMLVLFIYMASVASNEKFHMSMKLMVLVSLLMMCASIYYFYINNNNNSINNMESTESLMLISLFNSKTKMMTIMMVLYLFFSMITVSMIVNISEGPLRMQKK
uniref:NADH-ubiquinone oxidoreductase chain 6 n=1 Tax=Cletus rubidiventris TaxID=696880 RepID=A0A7S6UAX4_9HEMI|nr:NADH dehydrogenase subunit 6 [Cletus rubidiventris]QOW08015.1 NADH dehydrogenase subunit 6 [Cletus rubidiventris]